MKKLATILLICVLTGSFLFGAMATASPGGGNHLPSKCFLNTKYPGLCDTTTCKVYWTFTCPFGNILVFTGDFCC